MIRNPRLAAALVLLAGIGIIGGALMFQFVVKLVPCELCLEERWPWYGTIAVAALGVAWPSQRVTLGAIGVSALLLLGDAGLSAYHVAVEHHWVQGPIACTAPSHPATTVAELKAQIRAQRAVQCDQVQWSLFGISLAGYNVIASLAVAGFGIATVMGRRA